MKEKRALNQKEEEATIERIQPEPRRSTEEKAANRKEEKERVQPIERRRRRSFVNNTCE